MQWIMESREGHNWHFLIIIFNNHLYGSSAILCFMLGIHILFILCYFLLSKRDPCITHCCVAGPVRLFSFNLLVERKKNDRFPHQHNHVSCHSGTWSCQAEPENVEINSLAMQCVNHRNVWSEINKRKFKDLLKRLWTTYLFTFYIFFSSQLW